MYAKYRTAAPSRKLIVSSDKKTGGRYTVLTDWWAEMTEGRLELWARAFGAAQ
jgi:hypothetical protein